MTGDSFEKLCTDMDREAASGSAAGPVVGDFVDRLRVLLDELPEPAPWATALESKAIHPEFETDEDTPIYNSVLRGVTGDTSVAEFLAREADEAEEASSEREVPTDEAR